MRKILIVILIAVVFMVFGCADKRTPNQKQKVKAEHVQATVLTDIWVLSGDYNRYPQLIYPVHITTSNCVARIEGSGIPPLFKGYVITVKVDPYYVSRSLCPAYVGFESIVSK